MRITVSALKQIIKEEMSSTARSAERKQAGHESELNYTSSRPGGRSSKPEKKRLSKARRQTGKAIANSMDEGDWEAGDIARVGVEDNTFMIDPNVEDDWDLVPGSRTLGGNEPYSLDRDESGDYELPVGDEIEDFSDPYDDDFAYIDQAQRHEALQREASYESYDDVNDGKWSDVIVMSPNGDSVLIGGEETYPDSAPDQMEMRASESLGFRVPPMPSHTSNQLVDRLYAGMQDYFVEVLVSYSADEGWAIS